MTLQTFWFCLIAVLWVGLLPARGVRLRRRDAAPVAAAPRERDASAGVMFESIGPVWDGNEVWLVVAGGATFAAFPAWYATMFSGFYLALLLVLVLLIVQRRLVRVAREERGPALASRVAVGERGRQRRRRVHLGRRALEPRARRPAQRLSTVTPATSLTCSAPTPCLAASPSSLLFAFHGATYLTLRTAR